VKILLDENMPESLLGALANLGHEVDSVNHLKLKGLDNGTLYRQVATRYDLCFTRDAGFAHNVRQMRDPSQVKVPENFKIDVALIDQSEIFCW
jgi:predicted nuclease of predicted toxin-antitoxin system